MELKLAAPFKKVSRNPLTDVPFTSRFQRKVIPELSSNFVPCYSSLPCEPIHRAIRSEPLRLVFLPPHETFWKPNPHPRILPHILQLLASR